VQEQLPRRDSLCEELLRVFFTSSSHKEILRSPNRGYSPTAFQFTIAYLFPSLPWNSQRRNHYLLLAKEYYPAKTGFTTQPRSWLLGNVNRSVRLMETSLKRAGASASSKRSLRVNGNPWKCRWLAKGDLCVRLKFRLGNLLAFLPSFSASFLSFLPPSCYHLPS